MPELAQRIDFLGLISVRGADPNGDPLHGGRPRTDENGYGVISPVCIKRKLRDRLLEMGEEILVTPPEQDSDTLSARVGSIPMGAELPRRACMKWYDVRAFGQVFTFPGVHCPGVRGAVSIQPAYSVHPVKLDKMAITRCIPDSGSGNRTAFGSVISVRYGLYVLKGTISAYAARKNGFTEEDSEKLRLALIHIFADDQSAARPAGSMELKRLYWWKHHSMLGDASPAMVFSTVRFSTVGGAPECYEDYIVKHYPIPGLEPEIYEEPEYYGTGLQPSIGRGS